jgi:hypothetical protein
MKSVENLPLSIFVRFCLTGLVAIATLAFPGFLVLMPDKIMQFSNLGNILAIVFLGLVVGFMIDGLKIYQFDPGYKRRKAAFMSNLALALDIPVEDAPSFFVRAAQFERKLGLGEIDFIHSRWVMIDASGKLCFSAAILWGVTAIRCIPSARYHLVIIAVILFLLSLRYFMTARQERLRVEKLYIQFCKLNASIIRSWETPRDKPEESE